MDEAKNKEELRSKKGPHVLVIPHCSQGHIIPAKVLSNELVKQGMRVTLISHKPEIDSLISEKDWHPNTTELLRFVGFPRPNVVTESPRQAAILLQKSFQAFNMLDQLSGSDGPTCILSDMFNFWSTTEIMDEAKNRVELQDKKRPHVLVIPHCVYGQIIPALLLSKDLVQQGIRVTFVSHKPEIDRLISEEVWEHNKLGLLQFVSLPRPNVVTESPRQAASLLEKSFKAFNMLEQLSGSEGPTCVLSATINFWSMDLALQLKIPRYIFITCGATLVRFFQGCEDLITQGTVRVNADDSHLEMFDGKVTIPGLPALRHHEIVLSFRRIPLLFTEAAKNIMAASGILINTFYELEASVIDSLRNLSPIKGQKFYPIGPILQNPSLLTTPPVRQGPEQCIRWLDSQPDSSVLYISFGTLFRLKPLQITELALGLERSEHRFLWVLPHPTVRSLNGVRDLDPEQAIPEVVPGSDMLPPGFEERVAERGYVVKDWAPQVRVLSHPSTGGFLTHCGWNSCLEAVSSGVTMLAWPISAEQHLNCRHLVDELKVASEVKKEANDVVEQEEVERVVRLFMEEERMAIRGRINVLKFQAAAALGVGGSSTYAFQQLIQEIKTL